MIIWLCILPTVLADSSYIDAKWFSFPRLSHSSPYFGYWSLLCYSGLPQKRHDDKIFPLGLLSWVNCTCLSNPVVFLLLFYVERQIALMVWSFCWSGAARKRDVSVDLRVVIDWSNVRAPLKSSSLIRTALFSTPEMTWSRMRVGSHLSQQSLLKSHLLPKVTMPA